jgi:hypothetical protein
MMMKRTDKKKAPCSKQGACKNPPPKDQALGPRNDLTRLFSDAFS